MSFSAKVWTPEKMALAREALTFGYDPERIAKLCNVTRRQVMHKFGQSTFHLQRNHAPPSSVLIDRERRQLAERDLTGRICGDPPVGFSALDRRGGR